MPNCYLRPVEYWVRFDEFIMSFRIRKKIPKDIIRHAILVRMSQVGKTIRNVYDDDSKKHGHPSQIPHQNSHVWYSIDDLRDLVAKQISTGQDLLVRDLVGPHRINNEFHGSVREEINKLLDNGTVVEWSNKSWVFRLAQPVDLGHVDGNFTCNQTPPVYEEKGPICFGEEADMLRVFYTIMMKGGKDNTYKFVLAKTIMDYCKNATSRRIPYEYLASKFLEHYWYQEYKFRMKQDFKKECKPEVIHVLRKVFGDNPHTNFEQLDKNDILIAKDGILKKVFGHARKNTSRVVPRFQNIPGDDGDIVEYGIFYSYDDNMQELYLRSEALSFFKRNHTFLSGIVLAEWAKFLEKINFALPNLISKIEKPHREREPLTKYRDLYYGHARCCFYCGSLLEKGLIHVDHFIPWSYMFSNDAWNMVLACQTCNLKKSDRLPCEKFKNYLVDRNKRYYDSIPVLKTSLDRLDMGCGWEPEINNHYTLCNTYGFGKVPLP